MDVYGMLEKLFAKLNIIQPFIRKIYEDKITVFNYN